MIEQLITERTAQFPFLPGDKVRGAEMSEHAPDEPTVPLALWQSLNREFETTAKALCKVAFDYQKLKRESDNRIANLQREVSTYKERCEGIDMEGT